MISILKMFLILISANAINSKLVVRKLVVRVPHPHDIGLIMDLTVDNEVCLNQNEQLEFSVRCSACDLHVCPHDVMENAGILVGGYFGCIAAGATDTVSLIWPTVSLYNRVGSCIINIVSTSPCNAQTQLSHEIKFDTRFTTLDPAGTGIRKSRNYKDCGNYDLEYLKNCRPVNCEERYFGRRNYFNRVRKRCETVPECGQNKLYDPFANECVDSENAITQEDIRKIKAGDYKRYAEWQKLQAEEDAPIGGEEEEEEIESTCKKRSSYDNVFESNDENAAIIGTATSYAISGVFNGIMLVVATLAIYIIICFCIFLVVSCISKHQEEEHTIDYSITPSVSEKYIKLQTPQSILKRRINQKI